MGQVQLDEIMQKERKERIQKSLFESLQELVVVVVGDLHKQIKHPRQEITEVVR